MKKLFLFFFLIAVLNTANVINALALAGANAQTTSSYNTLYDDYSCNGGRGNCGLAVTSETKIEPIPGIVNTYRITVEVQEIITTLGIPFGITIDGVEYYTLPDEFKLTITTCQDYPILVNQQIDLSGKTVMKNGIILVQLIIQ